jgi:hypothetical protein
VIAAGRAAAGQLGGFLVRLLERLP